MKGLTLIIIGAIVGTVFYACSGGGRRPDYDDFPIRSKEFSVWTKCIDGDKENACKYVCTKYTRKNKCKKDHEKVDRINIEKALDNNFVLVSKGYFIQLIRSIK